VGTGEILGGGVMGKIAVEGSSGVMYLGSVLLSGTIGFRSEGIGVISGCRTLEFAL